MNEAFAKDVDDGLSAKNKSLPSKYFYDATGDALFVKIMNMPEYYLTNAELEILTHQTDDLIRAFGMNGDHFNIVELGAGNGLKVVKLLKQLNGHNFSYAPIDISANVLSILKERLIKELPKLDFDGKQGEYFEVLDGLKNVDKKVILFLGSNIGNLVGSRAHVFMKKVSESMNQHDKLLIGFDLKKDPKTIEHAYNDPHGFTRDFNLNLLTRINKELGGDFALDMFKHSPEYNPESGTMRSFLESLSDQTVFIKSIGKHYHFTKGECIHTENSQKYDLETIHKIAQNTGLRVKQEFYDSRKYFVDVLFEKV